MSKSVAMSSGGSMGGARGARPPPPATSSPFLDQTETRIAEKSLKETAPLPPPPEFREDHGINSS